MADDYQTLNLSHHSTEGFGQGAFDPRKHFVAKAGAFNPHHIHAPSLHEGFGAGYLPNKHDIHIPGHFEGFGLPKKGYIHTEGFAAGYLPNKHVIEMAAPAEHFGLPKKGHIQLNADNGFQGSDFIKHHLRSNNRSSMLNGVDQSTHENYYY